RSDQIFAICQSVFRLLIAPTGFEPGGAEHSPGEVEGVRSVIGNVKLDAAEGLEADGVVLRVQSGIDLLPWNVIERVPAALLLRRIEKLAVCAIHLFTLGQCGAHFNLLI